MQQRDVSKTDHEQGLYERYRVERIDGRTDEGGGYFVLRTHNLTNDKPEVAALRAYVAAVRGTHPELAADIEKMLPERAPSDGSIREDLLELADSIELNLDRTVEPEAARQNIDLFRQAADQLESSRGQLHHAQAVAETLWHTLNQIERIDEGRFVQTSEFRTEVRRLAARRTMVIAELPADETISDGAWIGVNTIRAELEELADLRVRTGVANAQLAELGGKLDQIAEMISPGVRDARVDDGKDTSWKAPDPVDLVREFVAQRRVFPADLVLRASMLALALQQAGAEGAGPTTTADAAKLLFDLVRAADKQPELVNDRFVDLSYMSDPDRTVLRFEGLPDIAVPDADVDTLVSEYMAKSPVRAARVMMQQSTAKAPRLPYYLPAATRTEIRGAAGEGMVTIITNAAGEIAQVTCHDVGPEPEEDGEHEETLAARCKVTSDNLTTLLGPIGGETQVPEPLWSGVVTASVLLDEVADTLRLRSRRWWVIEDMADGRDERSTLYAIPHDDGARDKAILQWAMTLELIAAAEEDRDPRDDVFDTAVGTLAFRPEHTVAWLEQHPGMLYFVQPPGAVKLVQAIQALDEDESLMIDDGAVVTTYRDSDEREVRELFRLLDFCDSNDDGVRTALSAFDGAEELDEEEAEDRATRAAENAADHAAFEIQRHEENLRDHEDFARRTDPPNQHIELGNGLAFISAPAATIQKVVTAEGLAKSYVQQGWMLHLTAQRVHLLDEMGAIACDQGATIAGVRIEPEQFGEEIGRELCGRCCVVANDRAAQAAADAAD